MTGSLAVWNLRSGLLRQDFGRPRNLFCLPDSSESVRLCSGRGQNAAVPVCSFSERGFELFLEYTILPKTERVGFPAKGGCALCAELYKTVGVGFEPTILLRVYRISSAADSTTLAPHLSVKYAG